MSETSKPFTIIKASVLAAGPSLHYVSGSVADLRMSGEYPPEYYATVFVVLPAPADQAPNVAFGAVAATRDEAIRLLAEAWPDGLGKYEATCNQNVRAVTSMQMDLAQSSDGQKMVHLAAEYEQKLRQLATQKDPVFLMLKEEIQAYILDVMYMLGLKEFDPTCLAVINGFFGATLREQVEVNTIYLSEMAGPNLKAFRAALELESTTPETTTPN